MFNAIGVLEVNFYTNAIVVIDQMLKAADVELVSCKKRLGGRLVHMIIAGKTSSVNAAIESAKQTGELIGEKNIKVAITISNPHPEIVKLLSF